MARRLDRARATLSTLDRTTGDVSYLGGMRAWMEGLIDLNQNRLHQARAHYRTALRRFEAIGETDSIGRICALLAETHAALGDPRQAWMYQRLALAQVPFIQVPRRKHLILQSGGLLCLRERMSHSALVFQNAVIGTAKAAGARLPSLVEGYLHRARTYARIGRQTDATTDLDLARALLPKIDAETVRRSYAAEIEGAAAEVLTIVSPDVAVAAASRALEYYDGNGEFKRAGLYLQRGRAQLARQRADLAEADFAAAIDRFEALREHVLERQDRVRLFRDGMSAYSEMVRLTVQNRQDPAAALDFAERARARTLLEALMGPSAKPDPVAMLARQVPAGTAVLFYGTQTDRLWLWVLRADGIRFFDRAVPLHDLQFRIARVGRLLTRPGSSRPSEDRALRQALQSLFTDLIGPARDLVGDVGALVVVPDGPLHSLPFAALVDPSTNQFLIQTHVIGVAPSLTTFRRALSDGGIPRRAHALVVGDPTIGDGDPSLGPLPFAREEAQNLGRIYAGARVLLEGAATPDAFLAHLQHADVVHYAGHAIVDMQEPDRSHLRLASDGAHPLGILFVHQLRSSMLRRHPLVVLAACSTNRGRIEIGEGVLSLARPFLAAGASDVIATLWDVEDRGSAELFTRFHKKAAAGVPAARALAEVQRDLLGLSDSDARGPANWAWAVAIGGAVR